MTDYVDRLLQNALAELMEKKNEIIRDKLEEKGFPRDYIDQQKHRRFKKVVVEHREDCEQWYVDNGTEEGVLIVTFLRQDAPVIAFGHKYECTLTLNYF